MEKILLIEYPKKIQNVENFDRVYYGHETCERLLPSNLIMAKKKFKKISFLTPPVTDFGINKIKKLLNHLDPEDEIIVNDLGVLHLLKNYPFKIIIGRILGRNILYYINLNKRYNDNLKEFISNNNIIMIETDYFNYKFTKNINFNFSYYNMPFIWTLTRRCAFNQNTKLLNMFAMCNKECLKSKAIINKKDKKFILEFNRLTSLKKIKITNLGFKRVVFKQNKN